MITRSPSSDLGSFPDQPLPVPERPRRRRSRLTAERRRTYLILVLPAVLIYWAVMAFPTLFSVTLSFTNYNGGPLLEPRVPIDFVGFTHYERMFSDPYFWIALKNNIYIVLISVFGQIPLGFIIAYVLFRRMVRGRDFFQTMLYLPSVMSTIAIGLLWQAIFSPYGPFTQWMQYFDPGWRNTLFLNPRTAMLPVLFVILWMYTGLYLIIFLANLQKINPDVIEAAKIDGANEWQVLRHVILPALSGVLVTTAILAISGSLKSFDLIFAMTAGNPARRTSVLSLYMYDSAFKGAPDYPLAMAISTFMVLFSFLLIIIVRLVERRFGGRE